ncbi:hypothetical protein [Peribacillus cavernae]|uniref:hypothetical protein n=1 Tax=Peribacillus cavernae TaxID=1674310 RepID=UPI00163B77A7|nr:hypothetical protein [Peribacillus cavernae]MDQ0221108.1 hypothetical protein [Peribacillus cavernae]
MEIIFQAIATIASCVSTVYAVRTFHRANPKPKDKHRKSRRAGVRETLPRLSFVGE